LLIAALMAVGEIAKGIVYTKSIKTGYVLIKIAWQQQNSYIGC